MTTNNSTNLKCFLCVYSLLSVIILTACKPNASTNKPFPGLKEWDLLIISDSTNWNVGQAYAKLIETDMGVKVNLHDCWVGTLTIKHVLETMQSEGQWSSFVGDKSCYKPLPDLIKEAEVMVLEGNQLESKPSDGTWDIPENFLSCYYGGYQGKSSQPGFDTYKENMMKGCTPETWSTYKNQLSSILDEINKIRAGEPLILRMTNMYIPIHETWRQFDVDDVCTKCFGYASDVVEQVAEEYGVPVADTMHTLSGNDKLSDPPSEYLQGDGIHPNEKGAQVIATLLQRTGYEYAGK